MESDRLLARADSCFNSGRYEEARDLLAGLLKKSPASSTVLRSLGLVHGRLGQLAQAARYCRMAVQADPQDSEAHFSLALLLLLNGNYEQGWVEYEWRLNRANCVAPRYAQGARWDGRPLDEEALMLHCEQGFGDNLQFIRFLPLLRERVKKIYLACHPELVRLFSGLDGLAGIVTDKQPLPVCQFHCPLLSLPHLFKVTLATIPQRIPYLPVSTALPERPFRPRVGIVWRANRSSPNSGYRSVPLADLRTLANLPLDWISLQRDLDSEELEILQTDFNAQDRAGEFRDFKDTADCLETLDLVITVDTSVAHLAGALGRPVCILLPKCSDWRWLLDRPDSPWYPTMRLFRQKTDSDWKDPLRDLRHKLEDFLAASTQLRS